MCKKSTINFSRDPEFPNHIELLFQNDHLDGISEICSDKIYFVTTAVKRRRMYFYHIHIKFHKDSFRHSKFDRGGLTGTDSMEIT
jgi:hypothetical protein